MILSSIPALLAFVGIQSQCNAEQRGKQIYIVLLSGPFLIFASALVVLYVEYQFHNQALNKIPISH